MLHLWTGNQSRRWLAIRSCKHGRDNLMRGIPYLAVVLATLFFVSSASAQPYIGVDLGQLSPPFIVVGGSNFSAASAKEGAVGTVGVGPNVLPTNRALYWKLPNGEVTDLTPVQWNGFNTANASATDGIHQVGSAGYAPSIAGTGAFTHAILWSGTAESAIDLNPTLANGFDGSIATGVHGNQEVGAIKKSGGYTLSDYRAVLWTGSAASAVELQPTNLIGFDYSIAYATDGSQQVGQIGNSTVQHAVLWTGAANTAVDLHPTNLTGFSSSVAYGVGGGQQVGQGEGDGTNGPHALLWSGNADSVVDLNPTSLGFVTSAASTTNGQFQAGYGTDAGFLTHAILWHGTADSAIDLQRLLPTEVSASFANTVDEEGIIYGTAYFEDGSIHAVEWVPVPEPAGIALAALAFLGLIAAYRRGKSRWPLAVS